jgi:hypothetical protein
MEQPTVAYRRAQAHRQCGDIGDFHPLRLPPFAPSKP